MTLVWLFHVFRDRASVPTGIKEFHLQIVLKHKKQVKSLLGKTRTIYKGNCLILGVAKVRGVLKCLGLTFTNLKEIDP